MGGDTSNFALPHKTHKQAADVERLEKIGNGNTLQPRTLMMPDSPHDEQLSHKVHPTVPGSSLWAGLPTVGYLHYQSYLPSRGYQPNPSQYQPNTTYSSSFAYWPSSLS